MTLKVNYATVPGEVISIVGETQQTGEWKDFSVGMMTWTEGNVWVKKFECERDVPFQYKYVVVNYISKEAKRWE